MTSLRKNQIFRLTFVLQLILVFNAVNSDNLPPQKLRFNLPRPLNHNQTPVTKNTFQPIPPAEFTPITSPPPGAGCIPLQKPCTDSKYRTLDGTCNNLLHPLWGSVFRQYGRLVLPRYADGIYSLPKSVVEGKSLPLPRVISYTFFPEKRIDDPDLTLLTMAFGQLLVHDMTLAMGTTPGESVHINCCDTDGNLVKNANSRCFLLTIPKEDPFYARFNVKCMSILRTITDIDTGCNPGNRPAEQLISVTQWIDASYMYANSVTSNKALREGVGGRLKMISQNQHPYPPNAINVNDVCNLQSKNEPCFLLGDRRGNQNPQLTTLHILSLREHNRIAAALHEQNLHWGDTRLFEEARSIFIAELQFITYYRYLVAILGYFNMVEHGLIYEPEGFTYDYDRNINPNILTEYATGASRYFHSNIQGPFQMVEESRNIMDLERLSDYIQRPVIFQKAANLDRVTRGMSTQSQELADQYVTTEVTRFLLRGKNPFGADLKSIDIMRDRDHAGCSYNVCREICGLKRARVFEDFLDFISEENVEKLKKFYAHPEDVEFGLGGALENHVPGAIVGPTFLCVLLTQFKISRMSDRYFFEAANQTGSFSPEQLREIRKASMSRIFCDNGDGIRNMQPNAFLKVSETNPLVSCNDYQKIPAMDFKYWKETPRK